MKLESANPANEHDWKDGYAFVMLKSDLALPPNGGGGGNGFGFSGQTNMNNFRVQSPFEDYLNIFSPANFNEGNRRSARLFNSSGQLIAECELPISGDVYSWSLAGIPNGFYIIAVYDGGNLFTAKVIKRG